MSSRGAKRRGDLNRLARLIMNEIATPLPGLAMTIKNSFNSDDRLKFSFIVAYSTGDNCEE